MSAFTPRNSTPEDAPADDGKPGKPHPDWEGIVCPLVPIPSLKASTRNRMLPHDPRFFKLRLTVKFLADVFVIAGTTTYLELYASLDDIAGTYGPTFGKRSKYPKDMCGSVYSVELVRVRSDEGGVAEHITAREHEASPADYPIREWRFEPSKTGDSLPKHVKDHMDWRKINEGRTCLPPDLELAASGDYRVDDVEFADDGDLDPRNRDDRRDGGRRDDDRDRDDRDGRDPRDRDRDARGDRDAPPPPRMDNGHVWTGSRSNPAGTWKHCPTGAAVWVGDHYEPAAPPTPTASAIEAASPPRIHGDYAYIGGRWVEAPYGVMPDSGGWIPKPPPPKTTTPDAPPEPPRIVNGHAYINRQWVPCPHGIAPVDGGRWEPSPAPAATPSERAAEVVAKPPVVAHGNAWINGTWVPAAHGVSFVDGAWVANPAPQVDRSREPVDRPPTIVNGNAYIDGQWVHTPHGVVPNGPGQWIPAPPPKGEEKAPPKPDFVARLLEDPEKLVMAAGALAGVGQKFGLFRDPLPPEPKAPDPFFQFLLDERKAANAKPVVVPTPQKDQTDVAIDILTKAKKLAGLTGMVNGTDISASDDVSAKQIVDAVTARAGDAIELGKQYLAFKTKEVETTAKAPPALTAPSPMPAAPAVSHQPIVTTRAPTEHELAQALAARVPAGYAMLPNGAVVQIAMPEPPAPVLPAEAPFDPYAAAAEAQRAAEAQQAVDDSAAYAAPRSTFVPNPPRPIEPEAPAVEVPAPPPVEAAPMAAEVPAEEPPAAPAPRSTFVPHTPIPIATPPTPAYEPIEDPFATS